MTDQGLQKLEAANRMLAEVETVADAKHIIDLASAAATWARKAKLGLEAQNKAALIKLKAERIAGHMLAQLERGKTGPQPKKRVMCRAAHSFIKPESPNLGRSEPNWPERSERLTASEVLENISSKPAASIEASQSEYKKALVDAEASRFEANRWQRVAEIPDSEVDSWIEKQVEAGKEVTTRGLLREVGQVVNCQKRLDKIAEISTGNTDIDSEELGKFPVLYADPPWRYEHSKTDSRKIENQYPTMSLDEICALKGAKARWKDVSAEERSAAARKAINSRWKKNNASKRL